jgi:hypothetical protein
LKAGRSPLRGPLVIGPGAAPRPPRRLVGERERSGGASGGEADPPPPGDAIPPGKTCQELSGVATSNGRASPVRPPESGWRGRRRAARRAGIATLDHRLTARVNSHAGTTRSRMDPAPDRGGMYGPDCPTEKWTLIATSTKTRKPMLSSAECSDLQRCEFSETTSTSMERERPAILWFTWAVSAPEPHSGGQGRFQPPNFTSASLLKTYRFHSLHILQGLEWKINDLPTVSTLFPAQACPALPAVAFHSGGWRHAGLHYDGATCWYNQSIQTDEDRCAARVWSQTTKFSGAT